MIMPSIVTKSVKGNTYIQYIERGKIVHCGRSDDLKSWKRAYNLYIDFLNRAVGRFINKNKPTITESLNIPSNAPNTLIEEKICIKITGQSEDVKWLEKNLRKLQS